MTHQSALLLAAFWSWFSGIMGTVLLGLLAPLSLALLVGMAMVALERRDWRDSLQMLAVTGLFATAGGFLIARVVPPAPAVDFWIMLSAQVGALTFVAGLLQFVPMARRRLRRDQDAREAVSRPLETMDEQERLAAAPAPRARLRAIEAEYLVAEWMRYLGATDSVVTPERRDGGVDVRSHFYVAQVKHRPADFVAVETVRALVGVAQLEGRTPLFFASGSYSRESSAFAREAGVALFMFRPAEGRLVPVNARAQGLYQSGLRHPENAGLRLAR